MVTRVYRNNRTGESVDVVMDGEAIGVNLGSKTAVRRTKDQRFAVIAASGDRLVRVFSDREHARNYNAKLSVR